VKKLRPGQIPDWRPGALYWKPLADGREVTVYPLLGGKARFCVGPLADPQGYDIAYRYSTRTAAIDAAQEWDPDDTEEPPGFEAVDFSPRSHRRKAPVHSSAVQVGSKMAMNDTMKKYFDIEEIRQVGSEHTIYLVEGWTEDELFIQFEAKRGLGDPMANDGSPLVTVVSASIKHGRDA
jgi:hypothetical protein